MICSFSMMNKTITIFFSLNFAKINYFVIFIHVN